MGKVSILGLVLAVLGVLAGEFGCNGDTLYINCSLSDLEVLTDFKHGLEDPESRLSSWKGTNCCQWRGISCDNTNGAVISVDLHNPYPVSSAESSSRFGYWNLSGEIRPSLLKLKSLQHLDLSLNTFNNIPIPTFLGSMRSLRYLNLSEAGFSGPVPLNLGNLSSLEFLDVSSPFSGLAVSSLEWVRGLVSLKHLAINGVDLSMVGSNWLGVLNMLPHLAEIHLSDCGLSGSVLSHSSVNFTSLSVIDLSLNHFDSIFPDWLVNISSLSYVDLSICGLYGRIPLGFSELPNLQFLSLAMNGNLSASCSQLFQGSWKKIEVLSLATNKLHGKLPSSIGNMSSLTNFDLFSNSVEGGIPSSIGKLCNLKFFDLSGNNLTGSLPEVLERTSCVSNNPMPSLIYLRLGVNHLVGNLPAWLGELENLAELTLDYNMIQGPIPASLGNLHNLTNLGLAGNQLNGSLPDSFGQLSQLRSLDVSFNHLSGDIPASIGDLLILQVIDLSNNSLEGNIPSSIGNSSLLKALDLSHNNLSGVIPELLGQLNQLQSIHLSNNNLTGKLPLSLQNLSSLETLDLGNNSLSGNIPLWIGGGFPQLRILSLRSNAFSGEIPSNLANLSSLQVLDLADNKLTGAIPETLGDFKAMSKEQYVNQYLLYGKYRGLYYGERFVMNIKGKGGTSTIEDSDDGFIDRWFYLSIGLGFAAGILVPMLVFAIKKPWRVSYFGFVDKIVDRALCHVDCCFCVV
ncbi:LRR receptor-like serine/threonine-protein kinase FLS2 [Populus alba x Populus x berolinensis]|uniref:LRR receptor-like serine/threonine-protein kinase FLS2 n=1 Tax=Populus alba x Populus x berolinensis TaxID=444605 RepID=A0AAD6RPW6_9ROSI|nr:LRR receptor-like serine/threonine-protein kinase FLS2 [Populus alba x Populus x berolinensis]